MRFTFPFLYYFVSRINSRVKQIAWAIVNVFPILWLCAMITDMNVYLTILVYFLALCAMMSIYEVGYLENDIITTKKEKNPTKRLTGYDQKLLEENYQKIIFSKYCVTLFILICLFILKTSVSIQLYIGQLFLSLVVLRVIYLFHNKIRNNYNILTFLGLIIFKHYAIILLFIPFSQSLYLLLLLLSLFCGQRLIEYSSKKRFGLNYSINNLGVFRVNYYFICLLGYLIYFVIAEGFNKYNELLSRDLFFPVVTYLFLFRLMLLAAGRFLGIAQGNE